MSFSTARAAGSDRLLRPGSLGSYRANDMHGPFVHVDTRSHRAGW